MAPSIPFEDYLAIRTVTFEWAESYDAKDWEHLKSNVLGPSIFFDFRDLRGPLRENLTPTEFAAIVSDHKVIGNPLIKTQHLLGGSDLKQLSDGTVQAVNQLRVAHQRYTSSDLKEVANKGHAHGATQFTYKKFGDAWKIIGVKPRVDWFEHDLFGTLDPDSAK